MSCFALVENWPPMSPPLLSMWDNVFFFNYLNSSCTEASGRCSLYTLTCLGHPGLLARPFQAPQPLFLRNLGVLNYCLVHTLKQQPTCGSIEAICGTKKKIQLYSLQQETFEYLYTQSRYFTMGNSRLREIPPQIKRSGSGV